MSKISPPPIADEVIDDNDKASLSWILFFNQLYNGDTGTAWTPTFTSLTIAGANPTITGTYYKISQTLVYFRVRIVPGTDTTSNAGTTFINNFPLILKADGACWAVSGLLGGSLGMCDQATNRIYTPAWSAVTVPLTVMGLVEVN